jgi:hypothetical protein
MRPLALAAALLAALPCTAQSTWYVDVDATPPGDGSAAAPYASIQYAVEQPTTLWGDHVIVAPGTYVESVDAPRAVRLRSSGGPLVTHVLPGDPSDAAVISVRTSSWVDGFTVTRDTFSPGQVGIRTVDCPQTAYVIRSCIVTNHAVGIAGSYDLFVNECTITANDIGIDDACELVAYLRNTIAWGNTVDVRALAFGVDAIYSSIESMIVGFSSLAFMVGDPLLWDGAGGDVHLRAGSPCIDAGDPAEQDPDGSRRDNGAVPYDPTGAPGTQGFCLGSAAACPCGNGGSGNGGCDQPQGTGGVVLGIEHFAPNGAGGGTAAIVGSGYPPAASPAVTLLRGPNAQVPPVVFGDGLRCIAAGGLVRIGAVLGGGGSSLHTISHGAGSGTFRYQLWTRSTPSTFCDPNAAFNLSNGLEIVWP